MSRKGPDPSERNVVLVTASAPVPARDDGRRGALAIRQTRRRELAQGPGGWRVVAQDRLYGWVAWRGPAASGH